MMGSMSERISTAQAERAALCDTFLAVGAQAPTLCHPWTARELAAHLVVREHRPDVALGIVVPALAGRTQEALDEVAASPFEEIVAQVRSGPPWWHPTRVRAVDAAVNTLEFVIHHEDVLRGDGARGPRRDVPRSVEDATWAALRVMAPLLFRRAGLAVELSAQGQPPIRTGRGPHLVITGEPIECALVGYGRQYVSRISLDGDEASVQALADAQLGL